MIGFRPHPDGPIEVDLPAEVRLVLHQLADELRTLLLGDEVAALRRLFPTAYPDDRELDEEFHQLMGGDLLESRLQSLDTFEASLDATQVSADELTAWMQATNSIRLVLGTQLDVDENDRLVDPDHPDAPLHAVYHLLNHLLGAMVDALSRQLD